MANFRCERLYVMLDEPVPGLDHLKAVDPVEFAHLSTDNDAERLGLLAFGDCTYASFDRKRWRPAAEGLRTVRGLLELYRGRLALDRPEDRFRHEYWAKDVVILEQVEAVLEAADVRGRRFYLAAKDLA